MWSLSVAGWHILLHDHCLHLLISLSLPPCVCVCVYSVLYTILLSYAKDSFNCFLASTLTMCNERNASVYSSFLQLTTQTDLMFFFAATIPSKKENKDAGMYVIQIGFIIRKLQHFTEGFVSLCFFVFFCLFFAKVVLNLSKGVNSCYDILITFSTLQPHTTFSLETFQNVLDKVPWSQTLIATYYLAHWRRIAILPPFTSQPPSPFPPNMF